jgi:anti-anti-sigma factor
MNDNRYLAALDGSLCSLKLTGRLTCHICAAFDSFCSELIGGSAVDTIVLDLLSAQYLDSTNIGLIAGLAEYQLRKTGKKMDVLIESGDLSTVLRSMGLEELMNLGAKRAFDPPPVYREIQERPEAARTLQSMMYASHKTLSDLNEKNRKSFSSLLDLLGKETRQA